MSNSRGTRHPAITAGPTVFLAISTTMHPDRKIGIAMGILLIGVVAALFFRNEPLADDQGLSGRREQELNQRLKNRDVAVYLETDDDEQVEPDHSEPAWTLSELFDQVRKSEDVPLPIGVRPIAPESLPESGSGPAIPESPQFSAPRTPLSSPEVSTKDDFASPAAKESLQEIIARGAPTEGDSSQLPETGDFDEYTVRFGDTLSEIAEEFLGSQTRYRELYEINRDRIDNPDRLKVGKAIRVPRSIH